MSIELKEEKGRSKIRQKDGTYVEMGLKTADFQSVDEILSVPGCMCNLMPAAMWDEQRGQMVFPVEYTLDKPHPQAFYTCSAEEWKTSATAREEWQQAQQKLSEEYLRKKEEMRTLEAMGIDSDLGRND